MNTDNDEKEISSQSWRKMRKSIHLEGYREGVSAGRDQTFQEGFDLGYQKGFEIGQKLGLHNGILRFVQSGSCNLDSSLRESLNTVEPFEKASRGLCAVCFGEEDKAINTNGASDEEETVYKTMTEIAQEQDRVLRDHEKLFLSESDLSMQKGPNFK